MTWYEQTRSYSNWLWDAVKMSLFPNVLEEWTARGD